MSIIICVQDGHLVMEISVGIDGGILLDYTKKEFGERSRQLNALNERIGLVWPRIK